MTPDEAERLARELQIEATIHPGRDTTYALTKKLCDFILSGDYKREIERQAYERCLEIVNLRIGNYWDRSDTECEISNLLAATTPAKEPQE